MSYVADVPLEEVIVCGVPVPLPDRPGQCTSVTFGEGTDEEPSYEVIIRRRRTNFDEALLTEIERIRILVPPYGAAQTIAPLDEADRLRERVMQLEEALLEACHLADTGWEEDHSRLRRLYGERIDQLRAIVRRRVTKELKPKGQ